MSAVAHTEANATHIAYISLGSNINAEANLPRAVAILRERSELEALSAAWRSPAVGNSDLPDFINAAARLRTPLDAVSLRAQLRAIEAEMGRRRGGDPNAARPIDLDILIFDGKVVDPDLWRYAHLAIPLGEIYPELSHPQSGQALSSYANDLIEANQIERLTILWH